MPHMSVDLNKLSDEKIAAIACQDAEAYGVLVLRHQQKLLSFIGKKFAGSISAVEAEEIIQEAFLKAYLSIARFDQNRKWKTWLYKIAINTALTFLRKPRHQSIEDHIEVVSEPLPAEICFDFEHNFQGSKLKTALAKLEPIDQRILELYYIKELGYDQIAAALNISINKAKIRVGRAKKLLTASYLMI